MRSVIAASAVNPEDFSTYGIHEVPDLCDLLSAEDLMLASIEEPDFAGHEAFNDLAALNRSLELHAAEVDELVARPAAYPFPVQPQTPPRKPTKAGSVRRRRVAA